MDSSCVGLGVGTVGTSVDVSQGGGSGREARADTTVVPSVVQARM